MTLTAGIIGVNWGLVHLHNLRGAGVHVAALCAADLERAKRAARAHGVERATADPEDLRGCDIVVVASPSATHARYLRMFRGRFVICEKPATGGPVDETLAAESGDAFVNYAFGFLDVARQAERRLGELGSLRTAQISTRVALDALFDPSRWFLEVASHPLAWLLHRWGDPVRRRIAVDASSFELELDTEAGVRVDVRVDVGGEPGIFHRVRIESDASELEIEGAYRPGQPWRFEALRCAGEAVGAAETGPGDPWLRANARSVEAMVSVFRGEADAASAAGLGLFDVSTALRVERALTGG